MNYRHIYHAGSFSDLIKHITLLAILNCLRKKDKSFAVLDAFAGLGMYDLSSEQALKTAESNDGIQKVLEHTVDNPLLKQLIDIALECRHHKERYQARLNAPESLERCEVYPGSPWIISQMLRPGDRLIASELHPQDFAHLRHLFSNNKKVAVHLLNAYNSIKAFVPFPENRGLIFLDPPFEAKDEFDKLIKSLELINHRAANICTMVWYPIKDAKPVQNFYKNCSNIGFKETLIIEFEVKDPSIIGLTKCGILITNPPYIHKEIEEFLQYIKKNTYQNQAEFKLFY